MILVFIEITAKQTKPPLTTGAFLFDKLVQTYFKKRLKKNKNKIFLYLTYWKHINKNVLHLYKIIMI